MKKTCYKLIKFSIAATLLISTIISPVYAASTDTADAPSETTNNSAVPYASDYIISYSGTASSKKSGSISLSAEMSVYDAGTKITAEIYKSGSFYDEVYASSSNDDLALVKTVSVPSGSYYVKYKYQAVVNGMVVEARTKTTPTFTVK